MFSNGPEGSFGKYELSKKTYFQFKLVAGQKLEVLKILKICLGKMQPSDGQADRPVQIPNIAKLGEMLDTLADDLLPWFFGAVLLEDGEQVEKLASVRSFSERGRVMMYRMTDGVEREIFKDFFHLNQPEIEGALRALDLDLPRLTSSLSFAPGGTSSKRSNSSPTGGDSIQGLSSGPTQATS
jgi:hypothetical protein